jgi:hypothetical protein
VHNFFARVNRRAPSAAASFGVAEFFASARVKRAQAFFCFYVISCDSIGISRILYKEARKFSKLQDDCASRDAGGRRRWRIMLWAAALTHKIKWSHCYFFAAVVIGL